MNNSPAMQPGPVPSLIEVITAFKVADFDTCPPIISNAKTSIFESELQTAHSVSISMPPSPLHDAKRNNGENEPKFYSQPMPTPKVKKMLDKRFDSFKTHLSHQLQEHVQLQNFPVDRYFDALQGPELDTLRASEEILLPEDKKWPFLLRFPITSFGICLGVSSQANMWKAISSTNSIHVAADMNLVLWFISVALFFTVSIIYALKLLFYFEAVRREYHHPIRVNFFFAPWITLLFLAHSLPQSFSHALHQSVWYVLMAPILCLEVKIYGQWMSGGQRRLSKVANPSNHLAVVGNFAGALVGATMGLKEGPVFFFAVGVAHYVVLFVTLYQRLPTNETLPKELHPVFFLFVAAPSVASMAWATIQGDFDHGSRIAYFIALFLYVSLAVRVNFFRGFRFSLAWWAYTFPMTGAAIATINYSEAVATLATKGLALILCLIATLTLTVLLVTTIIHAFILRDLFPNDIPIAIRERRPKARSRWYRRRSGSSDRHAQSDVEAASPSNPDSSSVSVHKA